MNTRPLAELNSRLSQDDWDTLPTPQKVAEICQVFVLSGRPVPGWETLRDVIGKGSATTINNARKAFLREHAEQVRKASTIPNVPEAIQDSMRNLWESAVTHGKALHNIERQRLEDERDQLNAEMTRLTEACSVLSSSLEATRQDKAILDQQVRDLREQLQNARDEAAALSDETSLLKTDLTRLDMRRLEERAMLQKQIEKIAESYEGLERHALKEIDRARMDARKAAEQAEIQKQQAIERVRAENDRMEIHLKSQLKDLHEKLRNAETEARQSHVPLRFKRQKPASNTRKTA
ncbi:MAG: DNA-binding protein [Hahellaceae bacterium]|nr:DNA-binding protein [Hahellaceae bacterium]